MAAAPFVLGLLALLGMRPTAAQAQPPQSSAPGFSKLIVFGDSLSDVGNIASRAEAKFGVRYPSGDFNYADGRFTDGPATDPASQNHAGVWHEQLARELGLSPATASSDGGLDFAFGGATTADGSSEHDVVSGRLTLTIDNMGRQVDDYLKGRSAEPGALYILWGGANDLLGDRSAANVNATAARISGLVNRLAGAGARSFLVANVPPLGEVPLEAGKPQQAAELNAASSQFRSRLNADLSAAEAGFSSAGLSVKVYRLDIFDLFSRVLQSPASYGFANVTQSAQGQPVLPDKYLFWDDLHPTTSGHFQIAQAALGLLAEAAPPALSLSIAPAAFFESKGAKAALATLSRSGPALPALTVALSSSDTGEARVPASVTLPAGVKTVTFEVAAIDDAVADGTQRVTISAQAASVLGAQAVLAVQDNESPALSLSLAPARVRESGASATILTIRRNTEITPRSRALTVSLSAAPSGQLSIPATVTIPARAAAVAVRLVAVNDKLADGPRRVVMTARASGFPAASAALTVEDDEAASRFSIAGRVISAPARAAGSVVGVPQVLVALRVGAVVYDEALSDAAGSFRFAGLPAAAYTLTVSKIGWSFTPAARSLKILDASAAGVGFEGTARLVAVR